MKNKYLTRLLCITIASAMLATGSVAVLAEDVSTYAEEAEQSEESAEPTETPAEPTEAPVEPTETPVQPTETPVEPTETPVQPTETPVEPTKAPTQPAATATPTPGATKKPTATPTSAAKEDNAAVTALINAINALYKSTGNKLTAANTAKVEELRAAYNKLSDTQKAKVTNYSLLVNFEKQITELNKKSELDSNTSAITGTAVYYVSNIHAGNEFYLNSLQENYALSFSDDFASVMDEIEAEYKAANGLTDQSDSAGITSSSDSLLVRNWQDILAVYVYEQSQKGAATYKLDASCKEDLARIFAKMNPLVKDEENTSHVSYANYHINDYIKKNDIAEENRTVLKKYVETDCKLLCAIVTDAKGFVRQSVGDDVSEERVNVIAAAYSLVGQVGYFWGGKSTSIGKDASWGSAAKVEAEGSASTGTLRAYGLDCSGFVTWSVINGYLNTGMEGVVGDGTSEQWTNANVISEADAQPGDLVFQNGPESGSDNHVGIICGKTDSGDWIAVHCSAAKNGVTVGEAYSASFRYIREPSFYPTEAELTAMKEEGSQAANFTDGGTADTTTTDTKTEDTAEKTADTSENTDTAGTSTASGLNGSSAGLAALLGDQTSDDSEDDIIFESDSDDSSSASDSVQNTQNTQSGQTNVSSAGDALSSGSGSLANRLSQNGEEVSDDIEFELSE